MADREPAVSDTRKWSRGTIALTLTLCALTGALMTVFTADPWAPIIAGLGVVILVALTRNRA